MTDTYQIDFEPLGRRGTARPGTTLLAAAQAAGVQLASVCGGIGTCEECRVRLVTGALTPPSFVEEAVFTRAELAAGYRLACQAEPLSDIKLDIPPESLTTAQRLQVEGQDVAVVPHPAVSIPGAYGLAVDIGTTKLAAYLVRLETGETVSRVGAMNPQVAYGEDVISRIAFVGRGADGATTLQRVLTETLNRMLAEMCSEARVPADKVLDAVLVGNTAMHQLFAGLPVEQLGHAPFAPATTDPLTIPASRLGLSLADGANVYLPPVVAGYVGADHLAMLLATGAWKAPGRLIALDIGTNTEISLVADGKVTCCSCASGPAFEGAHIHEGMRAAPGAVERARWHEGTIQVQTIEDQPAVGICGSGILDVIASLLDGHQVRPTGVMTAGPQFLLVPAGKTGLGRDLVVTRKDIHEIQLAKGAIRAGVEVLVDEAGLTFDDLDSFIVAGAFGTYLDLRSAVRVGMFPPLPLERFQQVGNAAGVGAKLMLVSTDQRAEAEALARNLGYVELTGQASFTPLFMKYLSFDGDAKNL
jgi:uncharacterized 2Fe-2S/4Fe-4S cluster protein (DUF4445 family)